MAIKLFKFQETAIDEMLVATELLLNSKEQDKYMLLEAITGAGKTVIALEYIQKAFDKFDDICFLWISLGKGGLHKQSYNRLRESLPSHINVKYAEDSINYDKLNHKDVLVVNWEKINTKKLNKDTGFKEFDNVIMRDGEKRNLPELLENTRDNGTKIILIIDESHNTANSDTSKEIINIISPAFSLEMTATPDKSRVPTKADESKGKAYHVYIDTDEVIRVGLLKKDVLINDFEDKKEVGVNKEFINAGIDKREEIKSEIERLNNQGHSIKFNPLALIQLPDGKEDIKQDVIQILKDRDITIENGKLAIWLSNENINKEGIEILNSNVEVLIFKQAVATGWDCPRACVLIRLREIKSIAFDLQTVGRILRMPERKHYNNSLLDNAFIFVNTKKYELKIDSYNHITNKSIKVRKEFIYDFKSLSFETHTLIRPNLNIKDSRVTEELKKRLKGKNVLNNSDIVAEFNSGSIETNKIIEENASMDVTGSKISVLSDKEIGRVFNDFFASIDVRNKDRIKRGTIQFFLAEYDLPKETNTSMVIQKSLINNKAVFEKVLKEVKHQLLDEKDDNYVELKDSRLEFDIEILIKETEQHLYSDYKKCAYDKMPVKDNRPDTEELFQAGLDNSDDVLFWIKNGDKGANALAVGYEKDGKMELTHPDYIVMLKDKSIAIFEVKGLDGKDIDKYSTQKGLALKEYINNHDYKGGLVRVDTSLNVDTYIGSFDINEYL